MSTEVCNEIFYLQRQLAQAQAVIAEQKETIEQVQQEQTYMFEQRNYWLEEAQVLKNDKYEQSELIEKLYSNVVKQLHVSNWSEQIKLCDKALADYNNWKENK